jgi:hypothetical protein
VGLSSGGLGKLPVRSGFSEMGESTKGELRQP